MRKKIKKLALFTMVFSLLFATACVKSEPKSEVGEVIGTCTVTIDCSTILDNMDKLKEEKKEFIPEDGYILKPTEVEVREGENAHDILKKVCQDITVHMESEYTPLYESAYVEGINQIYEFDCGELSGWMFQVNGEFSDYGPTHYKVKDGDKITWVYTCDLGKDVGAEFEE